MSRPLPDPAVQRLCRSIADEPGRPRRLAVVAPGGHGKTTAIAELAAAYRATGATVLDVHAMDDPPHLASEAPGRRTPTDGASAGGVFGGGVPGGAGASVLVVDDAHRLDETRVERLRAVVDSGRCAVLVACRPWPMSAALAELVADCERVMLSPLDRARAALVMATVRGGPPARELVEFVLAQTGGVPRFVRRLATVEGRVVPDSVLLAFRDDIHQLDDAVSGYLLAVDAGASIELVSRLLAEQEQRPPVVVARAGATGLVGVDGAPLPVIRQALAALVPAERRVAVRQRLARLQFDAGCPVLGPVTGLLDTGTSDPGMAPVFLAAAGEAAADRPALAVRCYLAAVSAGASTDELAVPLADAAARAGRLDLALRLADRVVSRGPTDGATPALEVAAAALAHRGEWAACAELYQQAGTPAGRSFATVARIAAGRPPIPPHPTGAADPAVGRGAASVAGVVPVVGQGAAAGAGVASAVGQGAAAGAGVAPVVGWGMVAGAAALMADGVVLAVGGHGADALSTLVRATTLLEPAGATVLLPDSPAALAAIVALHRGEPAIAESVLHRAATAALGGPLLGPRHLLLCAWTHLVCGRTEEASALLARLDGRRPEPRDALFAAGLRVGLARRAGDLPALEAAWSACGEAVLCHPVDLFGLLPLGEFAVAAARLGDRARLAPRMAAAWSLLAGLGDPPLWAASLHWYGMHAAVLAEDPAAATEHVAALARAAGSDRHARVLHAAARCWLGVLGGTVDADLVEAATGGLHSAGLSWDAARLAGQAAIRTDDRKDMVRLLDLARRLRPRSATRAAPPAMNAEDATGAPPVTVGAGGAASAIVAGPVPTSAVAVDAPLVPSAEAGAVLSPALSPALSASTEEPPEVEAGPLSAREWEVAELVVGGLTYKEVGGRLFISAKTVEHHVARMRRKLGCDSRGELMARLRELAAARV